MHVKLGTMKKFTWFFSLLFSASLAMELYVLFTELSDQRGLVRQADTGFKLFYLAPFLVYTLGLILNKTEVIFLYLLICAHCVAFDAIILLLITIGRSKSKDMNLLMMHLSFLITQAGLALVSFIGSLLVCFRISEVRKLKTVDVLKKYAFTRFNVLSDEDKD